jgi:CDP-glycerol glycerophosphotransferase (TagB/SpsB family)
MAKTMKQRFADWKQQLRLTVQRYYEKKHRRLPLQDTIVLECESDMDDNPRAIYEYLLQQGLNRTYKIVWLVKDVEFCRTHYGAKNVEFLNRRDAILKNWIRLDFHYSTAKWFVFSHPYWFQKRRKEQRVIFTGHGNPLKKGSPVPDMHKCYDRMLVTNEPVAKMNCEVWQCPEEKVFFCGYPRNDLLTAGQPQTVFSKLFDWQQGERVIMCMPTYKKAAGWSDSEDTEDVFSLCVVKEQESFDKLERFLAKNRVHLLV